MGGKSGYASGSIPAEVLQRRQQCSWLQLDSLSQEVSLPFLRGDDAKRENLSKASGFLSCPLCEEVMHAPFLGAHVCEQHVKRNQEYITVGDKAFLNCKSFPCVFRERRRSRHWHCICGKSLARFNTAQKHAAVCEIAMRTNSKSVLTLQSFIDLARKFTSENATINNATQTCRSAVCDDESPSSTPSQNTSPSPATISEHSVDLLGEVSSSWSAGLPVFEAGRGWPSLAMESRSPDVASHPTSMPMNHCHNNIGMIDDPMRFLNFCTDVLDPMLGCVNMSDPSTFATPRASFLAPSNDGVPPFEMTMDRGSQGGAESPFVFPSHMNNQSTGIDVLAQHNSLIESDLLLASTSSSASAASSPSATSISSKRALADDQQAEQGRERQRLRITPHEINGSTQDERACAVTTGASPALTSMIGHQHSNSIQTHPAAFTPPRTRTTSPGSFQDQSLGIAKVTIVSPFPTSSVSVPFFRDWPMEVVVNSVQMHVRRHLESICVVTTPTQVPTSLMGLTTGFNYQISNENHQLWYFSNSLTPTEPKEFASPKLLAPRGDPLILQQPAGNWIHQEHGLVAVCF